MSSTKLKTRTRILNATWTLLESGDAMSVRMGDIAREAGISRQALYQHFPTRAELLVATTRHIDEAKDVDRRLAASRSATTGKARLDAFIEAWGDYIPEIYGVGKALMAMSETDEAAALAWDDRMQAVRHGCNAAVQALKKDAALSPDYSPKHATDILWALLSVRNWEQLTGDCGWSQRRYIASMKVIAQKLLVAGSDQR